MTAQSPLDHLIRTYLEDGPTALADRSYDAVRSEIDHTRQRVVFGPLRGLQMPRFAPVGLVVAATLIVAVVVALNFGPQRGLIGVPASSPTDSLRPADSPRPTHSPRPVAPSPVATSPPPAIGPGAALTWSKLDAAAVGLSRRTPSRTPASRLAWVNGRYFLADQTTQALMTSTDGVTWNATDEGTPEYGYYEPMMRSIATWQDVVVDWSSSSRTVHVLRPPNELSKHDFEGVVAAAGIGPGGIMVGTHSALDFDPYITSLMGPGWVEHMTSFDFTDGILRITTDDGRDLEIVWAEHGFEPGDVADRGFGWHSVDGEEWRAIPDFPDNVEEIVGVDDGFIVRGPQTAFSADGQTWRDIGPYASGLFVPWMGGALSVPDQAFRPRRSTFDLWTSGGPQTLSIATGVEVTSRTVGTGPLGLVSLGTDGTVLYSPDGVDWSIAPMPEEMIAEASGRATPTVAVGERSVVVLVWTGAAEEGSLSPSLWLGTVEP